MMQDFDVMMLGPNANAVYTRPDSREGPVAGLVGGGAFWSLGAGLSAGVPLRAKAVDRAVKVVSK